MADEQTKIKRLLEICKNLTEQNIIDACNKFCDELTKSNEGENHYIIYKNKKYRLNPTIRYANNDILNNKIKLYTPHSTLNEEQKQNVFNSGNYREFFNTKFNNAKEISLQIEEDNGIHGWFPVNYTPGFSSEKWVELLNNKDLFDINSLKLIKRIYDCGGQATCKQLSLNYGLAAQAYNNYAVRLAQRIHKHTKCPLLQENNENAEWWPILFFGRKAKGEEDGTYVWKLRPELKKAIEKIDLPDNLLYEVEDRDIKNKIEKLHWWEIIALSMYKENKTGKFSVPELYETEIIKLAQQIKKRNKNLSLSTELNELASNSTSSYKRSRQYFIRFDNEGEYVRYSLNEKGIKYVENKLIQFIELNHQKGNNMTTEPEPALNQILYGPPGTGKTYNTVIEAMKIINKDVIKYDTDGKVANYDEVKKEFDRLKNEEHRIEFITFHQSYSYEEFVEGIKPYIPEWGENNVHDIKYIGKDGVFKKICDEAQPIINDKRNEIIDFSKQNIFKMSLGDSSKSEDNEIYRYCIDNNLIALGYSEIDLTECDTEQKFKEKYTEKEGCLALKSFRLSMKINDIVIISNGNLKFRAIGKITSDYYHKNDSDIRYKHFRNVEWLYNGDDIPASKIYNIKIMQSPAYKLKSEYINKDFLDNIISGNLEKENDKKYVLIIDEINRGNISKIFGELITLIEPDKRIGAEHELKVTLPYSNEPFGIPKNLYIIGTMNTADKSLALLDVALRRRFEFVPMYPKYKDEIPYKHEEYSDILEKLNKKILEKKKSADYLIGHSYFMGDDSLENIFNHKVIPLLMEYFNGKINDVQKLLEDIISEQSLKFDEKYSMPDKEDEYYYLQVKKA